MGLPGQVLLLGEVAVGLPGPDLISRNDLACAAAGATRKCGEEKNGKWKRFRWRAKHQRGRAAQVMLHGSAWQR